MRASDALNGIYVVYVVGCPLATPSSGVIVEGDE